MEKQYIYYNQFFNIRVEVIAESEEKAFHRAVCVRMADLIKQYPTAAAQEDGIKEMKFVSTLLIMNSKLTVEELVWVAPGAFDWREMQRTGLGE